MDDSRPSVRRKQTNVIVRLEKRPGRRPASVPHVETDAVLAGLRDIQLQFELFIEDARALQVRVADLIMSAKANRDELANLAWAYSQRK